MEYKYKGFTIKKRTDNRHEARKTINHNRISIYGKTILQCKENIDKYLSEPQENKQGTKFYDWIDFWLKKYKNELKQNSKDSILYLIKNHIKPNIPNIELKNIEPSIINDCIEKCPTSNMKEKCSVYLYDIMAYAFREGKLKKDITLSIKKYKHIKQEGHALTAIQRKALIEESIKNKDNYIFIFYLFSGARKMEALNFQYSDILENEVMRLPGTKTYKSDRIIPQFKILKEILKKIGNGNGKVFSFAEATLKRRLHKIRNKLNFHFTIKDLRTTFGTMCAEIGIADDVIAKWMGHTSTTTTKKYYVKVLSSFEITQTKLFDANFDPNF